MIFLIENAIPQKEDIILLYSGYHSIQIKYYSSEASTFSKVGRPDHSSSTRALPSGAMRGSP